MQRVYRAVGRRFLMALWLIFLAACGATPPPAAGHAEAPVAAGDSAATAPPTCLTFRDAELACERRCESIEPVLRTCATHGADGRMEVHFVWDGARTEVEAEIDGEHLERPAACVREVFARFVPCTSDAPMEGSLTLRFAGGWAR